jgi:type III pantothenate kinase
MVAVIDIGNHNLHVGLYSGEHLRMTKTLPRTSRRVASGVVRILTARDVSGCAIASVVPETARSIKLLIKKTCGVHPLMVNHRAAKGIRFSYPDPATLGADRIANIVGGLARYNRNIIVVDCGTAVTIDIALKSGVHKGGVIFPGMQMMFDALTDNTALLTRLRYRKPHKRFGTSTAACMRAGVHYGSIAAIDGMVRMLQKQVKKPYICIATGGWGRMATRQCASITRYDPSLTLYGVLKIFQRNTL